jgi:iron complex outermembrane receptor protein
MHRGISLGAVAAALAAGPAGAQDGGADALELETIVVESATRQETPADDLTRSVSVVTRETLDKQRQVNRSVGDVLGQETPGLSPSTESNSDFAQTLRGRGFLTLIDGVPQTTTLRDGRRSLNSIDPEAIERIEVIRGGTAVYGFGASGGLVNIVTRRPEDGAFNANLTTGFSFSATHPGDSLGVQTRAGVSGRQGPVDYLLQGSFLRRGGRFDAEGDRIPADPVGAQGGLADSDAIDLLGKIGLRIDEAQRLELAANWYDFAQDSEFAGISFAGDPATGARTPAVGGNFNPVDPRTETRNLDLEYEHADVLGSAVKAQACYADNDVAFSKFPGFAQTRIRSEKAGGRLTVTTPVELGPLPFDVIWGVDCLHDETRQTAADGPNTSPRLEQDAVAGFAQLEIPLGDRALVTGGARYEDISVDASDFTRADGTRVRGGALTFGELLLNATGTLFLSEEVDLYGGFSQGFALADIGRSISDGTFATARQAESEAQKTDSYELGLRADHGVWEGALVGFYNESDNGVSFDANLDIVKRPERIWGVEAAGSHRIRPDLRVGGTLTWMQGEVDLDDDGAFEEDLPSTRIPPLKATAWVEYEVTSWARARLQGLYSGDRTPDSTQFGGTGDIDHYTSARKARLSAHPPAPPPNPLWSHHGGGWAGARGGGRLKRAGITPCSTSTRRRTCRAASSSSA